MKIAHITDIHFQTAPDPLRMGLGKRWLGSFNLYALGRRHEFALAVQQAVVARLEALAPDLVLVSGDLTAQAIPAEFALARATLAPVLDQVPTFVVAGNHDAYTRGAARTKRITATFGPWMGLGGPIARRDVGGVTVLGLDPNRPGVLSSGRVPDAELDGLRAALADPALADRFVVLVVHYPLYGPTGKVYDNVSHGLVNARAVLDVFDAAPKRPDLVVHGHKHHGYGSAHRCPDGQLVPIRNPGSSGQAHDDDHDRAASIGLYTVEAGQLVASTRERWTGHDFADAPWPGVTG